jgi:glycosyltransferase involved in cell wall biosynthesis
MLPNTMTTEPVIALTVVIPLFNSQDWISGTLNDVFLEVETIQETVEIIVVNDGSTDQSLQRIQQLQSDGKIKVITTSNEGRFSARATGVKQAGSEYVVFIDSRVKLNPGSLKFILQKIQSNGLNQLWNARVSLPDGLPKVSYFWEGIEFLAWRKHHRGPQETSVKKDDLDFHPVGTTMFGAPRQWLLEVNEKISESHLNLQSISDDTKLIRHLAERADLNYSPMFSCVYQPRTTSVGFASHAFHRGTVFVDGHLRKGGRYVLPFLSLIALQVLVIVMLVTRPIFTALLLCALVVILFSLLKSLNMPKRARKALMTYGIIFAPAYFSGAIAGLASKAKNRFPSVDTTI